MIFPNNHPNSDGDIVFEISHISESSSKKEREKGILDKTIYKNWITVDPITISVIKSECECQAFIFNGTCKHLRESLTLLSNYGIKI